MEKKKQFPNLKINAGWQASWLEQIAFDLRGNTDKWHTSAYTHTHADICEYNHTKSLSRCHQGKNRHLYKDYQKVLVFFLCYGLCCWFSIHQPSASGQLSDVDLTVAYSLRLSTSTWYYRAIVIKSWLVWIKYRPGALLWNLPGNPLPLSCLSSQFCVLLLPQPAGGYKLYMYVLDHVRDRKRWRLADILLRLIFLLAREILFPDEGSVAAPEPGSEPLGAPRFLPTEPSTSPGATVAEDDITGKPFWGVEWQK